MDFDEICANQLEKLRPGDLTDKKVRDKITAALMRRGFSLSEIKSAISEYKSAIAD